MRSRVWSLGLILAAATFGACATESTPTTEDSSTADRGPLGKADLVGSCQNPATDFCGGKGTGNCWCDDLCVEYGDCCSDVDEVCGIEPPAPEGQPCGGFLGNTCNDNEYCAYVPGEHCGAADASSTCEPRPEACIELFAPVCGCDGNTYDNSCFAAMAGTGVVADGECVPPPPGSFCGGFAGIQCPEGQICVDDPNDECDPENGGADCGGICQLEPEECEPVQCEIFCPFGFASDPVTGCDICECEGQPVESECVSAGGTCFLGVHEGCDEGFEEAPLGCGVDVQTTCCAPAEPEPEPTCEDACGGPASGGACWCDDLCGFFGDCCADADEWCQ